MSKPITASFWTEIAFVVFQATASKILAYYPSVVENDQWPHLSQIVAQCVFTCPTRIFARKPVLYSNKSQNNAFCNGHVSDGDELAYWFQSKWNNFIDAERFVSQNIATYWTKF